MVRQHALHISAIIAKAQLGPLQGLLDEMAHDPGGNSILPFAGLDGVHFGRLLLVPGAFTNTGEWLPDTLVLTTNFDGSPARHLRQLAEVGGEGLDQLFSHCADYPSSSNRNVGSREAYLDQHSCKVAAFYVNTRGRNLEQVADEARLHQSIQDYLDRMPGTLERKPSEVYSDIQAFLRQSSEFEWALTPVTSDFLGSLLRWLKLTLAGLAALASAILLWSYPLVALVMALIFLAILRAHELGNVAENFRPPNIRIAMRQSEEEQQTQNQLSSVGFVQTGLFRRVLIFLCLWSLDFANRNIFYRGQLAGVDTIHFARWVMSDSNRRVLFLSNFDGSPETYQDDFIERVALGLNLVFSNGSGWPKSHYLVFGGASDEQAFRAFYRDHQIPTQVWYAAAPYQGSTAVNIARNSAIRAGLCQKLNSHECQKWLQLF